MAVDDDADDYPTLAKYASPAWLKDFIRNPGAERHYGSKNQMPAYSPEKLGDSDLNLLVRWITHDYPETRVDDYPSMSDALRKALAAEDSEESAGPQE